MYQPAPPMYGPPLGEKNGQPWDQYQGYQYQAPPLIGGIKTNVTPLQSHTIIIRSQAGPYPYRTTCHNCRQQIITATTPITGGLTWLAATVIAMMGGVLGCCLVPFCAKGCKDVEHRCPMCHIYIATHKRLR
ncbi:Lipopolysaccharide-induced tumor necrosis factor-alpha factor -like protein [Halotydeus destructor]|nr:Lipopolysaccharide-induced tumor necrosis factor-alpha factor -like protein [Halotydeus destructor]